MRANAHRAPRNLLTARTYTHTHAPRMHCTHTLLVSAFIEREAYLVSIKFDVWRLDKEPGNHLTPFWLYCRLADTAPSASVVVFGATDFDAVNPVPHMYCRGKTSRQDYLGAGYALLLAFLAGPAGAPVPPPLGTPPPAAVRLPTTLPPPPALRVLADWDPLTWVESDDGYLGLVRNERLIPCCSPEGVDPEGWAFAFQPRTGIHGFFPPEFTAV